MSSRRANKPNHPWRILAACLIWFNPLFITAEAANSGISFPASKLSQRAAHGVDKVEFVFKYRNGSGEPVAVDHIEEGCGCFKGEVSFEGVGVNEEGQVRGTFLTKGLYGTVTKSMWVVFSNKERHELVAEVTIPEVLVVEPSNLVWQRGSEAEERVVDVRVEAGPALDLTGVLSSLPQFSVRSETVVAGKHYVLHVRPMTTEAELSAVLQVRTSSKDPRDAIRAVFASVSATGQEGGGK
jgi:hypothetical protein